MSPLPRSLKHDFEAPKRVNNGTLSITLLMTPDKPRAFPGFLKAYPLFRLIALLLPVEFTPVLHTHALADHQSIPELCVPDFNESAAQKNINHLQLTAGAGYASDSFKNVCNNSFFFLNKQKKT
uniref:(northern house mosquito) hypothetical protein n=1 Tax=Culex pipiens TaxID=7175 RepID=A0A8D8FRK2_CULPI